MKLVFTLTFFLAALGSFQAYGQNSVVIGTMVNKPNALLVLNPPAANQGFLLPQLTSLSRLSINPNSPSEDGLIVYDITEKEFYHWKSGQWIKGLGNANQSLAFNQSLELSISNGNKIDLSELKEIPSQNGQSGKFITTDGTTLSWANVGNIGDITSIITGRGLTGGGTTGDVTLTVSIDNSTIGFTATNQLQLINNSVSNAKLADNAVTTAKITDNSVSSLKLQDNAVTTAKIANNSVSNLKLADDAVTTAKIADNSITSATILDGAVTTPKINDNAVTTVKIADGGVTTAKLSTSGVTAGVYGNATNVSQVTVDSKGRVTAASNVPITGMAPSGVAGGDLSGSYPSPKVSKLQGNNVSPAALAAGDNGKILVWDGTQWNAQVVTGITATTQYYNLDPSDFRSLRTATKQDHDNGMMFDDNTTYITVNKKNEGSFLIAPLHLPNGALIQQITVYYMDRDAKNITLTAHRKTFTGANDNIIPSWTSTGSSGSIQSSTHNPIAGKDVIDNALYTYRLVLQLDATDDATDSNDADHRIYAVQVRYLK